MESSQQSMESSQQSMESSQNTFSKIYFNCGKMGHIYKIDKTGKENKYEIQHGLPVFASDEAREAYMNGTRTIKFHGQSSIVNIKEGKIYKRYDSRGKAAPEGSIPLTKQYGHPDTVTGHTYSLIEYERPEQCVGKKQKKLAIELYTALDNYLERMREYGKRGDVTLHNERSVEVCGPKFQGTPGINKTVIIDHELETHYKTMVQYNPTKTYSKIFEIRTDFQLNPCFISDEKLFDLYPIEGLIFRHPTNNNLFKLRANLLNGKNCEHEVSHKLWLKHLKKKGTCDKSFVVPLFSA